MKGRTVPARLSALALAVVACSTITPRDEDKPAGKCNLQPAVCDFGEVLKGGYALH